MPTIPDGTFAAVLGSPIAHSLSPTLHLAAYAKLGLDWKYEKYEVLETELKDFLTELSGDCRGLSLTMPLKAQAFLLAESTDTAASKTRACNTLIRSTSGWTGYNTDVPGFVRALESRDVSVGNRATIIGAGATARSAIAALSTMGVAQFDVLARRVEQVRELAGLFQEVAVLPHAMDGQWPANRLLVSTLPSGALDKPLLSDACEIVFDVVYAPWPTALAEASAHRVVLSGLDLLVHQAAVQVHLMTGCSPESAPVIIQAMYSAGLAEQARRSE